MVHSGEYAGMDPFLGSQALARGAVTRSELRTRYRRVFRDVYVGKDTELTAAAKSHAAWLSTGATLAGLSAAAVFGTKWLAMLAGFAFFSHQVGGFLGVWIGGLAYEHTGSYDVVWWLSILFGVLSALINLPIVEAPVARPVAQPA